MLTSTDIKIGTFYRNGVEEIFAKAPINLKYNMSKSEKSQLKFQVFICQKVAGFT